MQSNQRVLVNLAVGAVGCLVKYIAYNFFTPVVLLTFAAVATAYIMVAGPQVPFLQYVSFLLPIDRSGNANIDGSDVLRLYNGLTGIFFVLSLIGSGAMWLLRRVRSQMLPGEPGAQPLPQGSSPTRYWLSVLKGRLVIGSLVISMIYLVLFLVLPAARLSEGTSLGTMYVICVVFYGIALVSNAIYVGIDTLSNGVLGWALANR